MATEAQNKATKKYHAKFERIEIIVPKGEKEIIKDYAKCKGESVTQLILRLLNEEMKK